MEEISEPLISTNQTTEITETPCDKTVPLPVATATEGFDPKTMRTTKPGRKRLFLTFSVLLSFLLGFPLLWKSVEIYRSPLPFADMDALSKEIEANPLRFPCRFHAIFLSSDRDNLNPNELHRSLLRKMTELTSETTRCGSCFDDFNVSVTVDSGDAQNCGIAGPGYSYQCGSIGAVHFESEDDERVDEALGAVLGGGRVYNVVIVAGPTEGLRVVVGKYRHAWIVVRDGFDAEDVVESVAEVFVKVFVDGGREEGSINAGFIPVGADGRIVLSFNLLNADPRDWVYDWDFWKIHMDLLVPVIEALAPVANISVESQVLYHTPKSSFSAWNEKLGSYVFSTKDLPFFVNSNEWHLDTSIAAGGRTKILQFVVYVPSAKECPLLLHLPDGEISATNGFISPMWGGVMFWNPYGCSKYSESKLPVRQSLSSEDLEKVFGTFMGQLRQLFGLKSNSFYIGASQTYKMLASERGFTEWELDFLSRQHTCFNLHSSATTLGSLSRLVQSLPRMIIMDEIGKQVKFSLEAAKLAQLNASLGVFDASVVSSRQARSLAEDAFFHPSIMSVSYYSFEHCFAVYSPFFLPVSMHVLLATLKEWRRYKQEMAKYLRWKTTA